MSQPISVLCDRCGAQGHAGEAAFADLSELLDFTPVPRKKTRVDGWTPERQRAFVIALATLGSFRRAAHAIGMAQFGAERLLEAEGGEGFARACDAAMARAAKAEELHIADSLAHAASRQGRRRAWTGPALPAPRAALAPPAAAPQAAADQDAADRAAGIAACETIIRNYFIKLTAERKARLAGRVIEADMCLRQITVLEVMLDLLSQGQAFDLLAEWRQDGKSLIDVAETPMSRLLDEARRVHWEEAGDPPRPPSPRDLMLERDGVFVTPGEFIRGGPAPDRKAQAEAFRARHAAAAQAQVEWEAAARQDHDRRREAPPDMAEETGLTAARPPTSTPR